MQGGNAPDVRYPAFLRTTHWLLTFAVAGQLTFIFSVARLQSFEFANAVLAWHRSLGILIFLLVSARVVASFIFRAPAFPKPMRAWQVLAAKIVHLSILAILLALPVIGIAMAGARGDDVSFFGLFRVPEVIAYDPDLADTLLWVHALLATVLAILLGIHLAAVAFHFIVQKRNLGLRMLAPPPERVIVNRVPIWVQIAVGAGCLLALTLGIGMYAENGMLEATQLRKALDTELLEIGDDISGLQGSYAALQQEDLEPAQKQAELVSMQAMGLEIRNKTIDPDARLVAQKLLDALAMKGPGLFSLDGVAHVGVAAALGDIASEIDGLAARHRDFVFRQRLTVERTSAFGHDMILVSIVPTALVGLLISLLLSRNMLRPLGTARMLAARIAAGNLTNERRVVGQGETAQLVRELLAMQGALRTQMVDIARLARERQAEHLEAERLRIEKEAAEAANRTKSSFLATMSHELRTPLNAIIGFSEILKREMFGPLENKQYVGYASDIFNSGTHLLNLINEILDMSRLESRQLELRDEEIDISALIGSCLRLVTVQAEEAKVRLESSVRDDVPFIRADDRRIRQILINLLANAVKFTPEGGRVHVSAFPRDGGLGIVIADTGIGIAPENIAKAMQPFGQIDNKLSRKYAGAGLGLPLANQLVALHGGTLTLESELERGTKVTVFLPPERVVYRPASTAA